MDQLYNLEKESEKRFLDIFKKKSFPLDLTIQFVGNEKQNQLVKLTKIPDEYAFLLNKEILVSFNEDLLNKFDKESCTILIEQEINKLSVNIETGKIKITKPDLTTSSSIISKYGIEKVIKANQIVEILAKKKEEEEIIS